MPRSTDLDRLERIESLLQRLDAAVVVRDPGNARSAEAFDGLRKLLIQSGSSQRIHVAHLLSLSDSLERGAGLDLIQDRVADFLLELGVSKSTDIGQAEHFEFVDGTGPEIECLTPAVIQTLADRSVFVIRKGTARRVEGESTPENHPESTDDSAIGPTSEYPASKQTSGGPARTGVLLGVGAAGIALGLLVSQLF